MSYEGSFLLGMHFTSLFLYSITRKLPYGFNWAVIVMSTLYLLIFIFSCFYLPILEYIDDFFCFKQGRRNSVVVRRDGFKELYMFSPGCNHEYYSKYTYICVGQSAVLEPITLGPEDVWKGEQHLHNPNL